jgi:PST family polysaccharide transporter
VPAAARALPGEQTAAKRRSDAVTEWREPDELDTKIMRSSAWAVLGFGGTQALSLVTTIVLARLLVPSDFGLVALALAVLAVAQIAQESGLGAALIVHRGELRPAVASVSVFSPLVACALYVVAFATAPLFANIFDQPRLTAVLQVTAVVLILRGFSIAPLSLLQREMRFGPLTAIELAGGIVQAGTAIVLAVLDAGVWSLVLGQLGFSLAQLVLAWWFSPLRPSPLEARRATLRELMRFGRHVGLANFINYGNTSAEGMIVGHQLGATSLGYYSLANRLASMPVSVIGNILGRGVFAALSRLQDDMASFRRVWLENVQRLALLTIPAVIGVVLVAEPLVVALLGTQWRPAIAVLQILALNGIVRGFAATSGEVFQALHRPKLRVYVECAHLALLVPGVAVGASWFGLKGAAGAVVLVNALTGGSAVVVVMRLLDVRVRDLARAILRPIASWALLAAALLSVRPLVDELPAGLALTALVTLGVAVYAIGVALFARDLVSTMWISLRGTRTSG